MGIVAVVVTPLQFFDIAIHMLDAHFMERAYERTLKQAPDTLNAVRMNIAHNPFIFGMPHSLMACVVIGDTDIRPHFIRIDGFCLILYCFMDKVVGGLTLYVWNTLYANLSAAR